MNPGNIRQCNTSSKRRINLPSHSDRQLLVEENAKIDNNVVEAEEDTVGGVICDSGDHNVHEQHINTPGVEGEEEEDEDVIVDLVCPRPRSGSWTGVNESDDELERLSQHIGSPTPLLQINGGIPIDDRPYTPTTSSYGTIDESNNINTSTNVGGHHRHYQHYSITEEKIRRKLKFYFMNPIEKWHARRRFPWKLLLQVFKIIIVTAQLCLFASQRYNHVTFLWHTKISFQHLFIKEWDPTREVKAYPPSLGALAVYQKQTFYNYVDFAVLKYATIGDVSIGTYDYERLNGSIVPSQFCIRSYKTANIYFNNNSYFIDKGETEKCFDIYPDQVDTSGNWSLKEFLANQNYAINFDGVHLTWFSFKLIAIKLRINLEAHIPECYGLDGIVFFDNRNHDGQMLLSMQVTARVLKCVGNMNQPDLYNSTTLTVTHNIINISTITICLVSFAMCCRALYRAQLLRKATVCFFSRHMHQELSLFEKLEFLNLWYVCICFNDILIILGSVVKICLENEVFLQQEHTSYEGYLDTWNACSLLLGLGNLLVWFGCLRYLGFFETYNVLILTIKTCIPNVLRYSIGIMMVFAGYCLCGWLVLGPYHLKFRTFSSTMECLYSLINGDDMFATFSSTSAKDPVMWWFSRIYLYTFISLFIYVILSLFIAIIMDAYETVKKYYDEGFPYSPLMRFVNQCTEEPSSGVFNDEGETTIHDIINTICCCGYGLPRHNIAGEYEPLVT